MEGEGAYGVILDGARGQRSPRLPVPVGYDSLLSNDRRWIVQLADEGGSEVGHLCGFPVGSGEAVDLTPERDPYVVRGVGFSADGSILAASVVDERGYHLLVIPASPYFLRGGRGRGARDGRRFVIADTLVRLRYQALRDHEGWLSAGGSAVNFDLRAAALTVHNGNVTDRRGAIGV